MKIREARPIRVIGKVKTPILFLHGRKDAFSLPKRAEELYAACNAPKELSLGGRRLPFPPAHQQSGAV